MGPKANAGGEENPHARVSVVLIVVLAGSTWLRQDVLLKAATLPLPGRLALTATYVQTSRLGSF